MTTRNADPLLRAFARLGERRPGATLIASPTRGSTVADVAALSRQLGTILGGAELAPGAIVGLAVPNGPGFLAAVIALRTRGHPVLLIDALAPVAERRRVVAELGAAAVLSTAQVWPTRGADFTLARSVEARPISLPGDSAIIKLTSGSAGAAQGIAVGTRALIADDRALVRSMGLRREDLFVAAVPFSHSYGFSSLVLPALLRGNPLVLADGNGPLAPLEAAARTGATVFPSVPSYLAGLAKASVLESLPPSLRLVVSAGAPLPMQAASRFRRRFGKPIQVFYGASECGGITFDREGSAGERGTVGEPLEGVSVILEPCSAGGEDSAGRVVVVSDAVADGYLPAPDPRLAGGRFRSDDLGSWAGGELELLGKASEVINVHGRKVNPRDVERTILELDGADEVAVTSGGDAARQWVEAVVACSTGALTARDVVTWCRSQLAPFKIPRRVVVVPALPRDQRGKLRRVELSALTDSSDHLMTGPSSAS